MVRIGHELAADKRLPRISAISRALMRAQTIGLASPPRFTLASGAEQRTALRLDDLGRVVREPAFRVPVAEMSRVLLRPC